MLHSLKMKYSDTGNSVVVTATFFCHLAKTAIHFLVKKPLLYCHLLIQPKFFNPLVIVLMGFHCSLQLWNRQFAWWHHFSTMTRILQGFAVLSRLGLLLFKPHWDYKIFHRHTYSILKLGYTFCLTPSVLRIFFAEWCIRKIILVGPLLFSDQFSFMKYVTCAVLQLNEKNSSKAHLSCSFTQSASLLWMVLQNLLLGPLQKDILSSASATSAL